MTEDLKRRQLGQQHDQALDNFGTAVSQWAVPFLRLWMNGGPQPRVSPEEQTEIRTRIAQWQGEQSLPEGYEWFPEFARRASGAIRFNRRNFLNIHPTPHIPSVLASMVIQLQNPNNIVRAVSEMTTELELESIRWMAQNLAGFDPEKAWGNVVSGGTIANITAMLVARDYSYRKLTRPRPANVRQRGLYNLPAGVVLATAGSHYSIKKALWVLGMGDENVVDIPVAYDERVAQEANRDEVFVRGITDSEWSARISGAARADQSRGEKELEKFYAGEHHPFSLQPLNSEIYKALYGCFEYGTPLLAYVFTVGTTDTGTIERPNAEALKLLLDEDVYVHADAAAGGFALMHSRLRSRTEGLGSVHSITIDGHKLGQLPYPNGAVLFRDKGRMYEIMQEAPYLTNLAPTLEGSRPGSHAAALWAVIQDLANSGRYVEWLDRLFQFTDQLVSAFKQQNKFQILHDVDLTTVAVAPRAVRGESRTELNQLVERLYSQIEADTSATAYAVNIDRGLSGIKVFNSNRRDASSAERQADSLIDIYCLRMVAANPIVESNDAVGLVGYLETQLDRARGL